MKNKLTIAIAVIYLLALPAVVGINMVSAQAGTPTLFLALPGGGTSTPVNSSNEFDVQVRINTGGQSVYGVDPYITYTTSELTYKRVSYTGSVFTANQSPGDTGTSGVVKVGATIPSGSTTYINTSSGLICTLTFSPVNTIPTGGLSTTLGFVFVVGGTQDSRITSSTGADILGAAPSLAITITAYVPPVNAPHINSIAPTEAWEDDTLANRTVTLTGDYFGSSKGKVYLDTTEVVAADVTWGTNATSTGNTVVFIAPTRSVTADTNVAVSIKNASGTTSDNTINFKYKNRTTTSTDPHIDSISPSDGFEDVTTTVTLTGTNFGSDKGTVYLGNDTITAANVTWSTQSATSQTVIFIAPIHAVDADTEFDVKIHTTSTAPAGAKDSNVVHFTYKNKTVVSSTDPNITSLSPSSGRADADVLVTITGTNFLPTGATQGTVKFGTFSAVIVSWTDTQIKVYAPKITGIRADVGYTVTVTRTDGKYDTDLYTYLAPISTGGGGGDGDGGDETPDTGMPSAVWLGLIPLNGLLALAAKRWLF